MLLCEFVVFYCMRYVFVWLFSYFFCILVFIFCIIYAYLFVFYLFLLYFCSGFGYFVVVWWGIRYSFVGGMVYYFVFIVRFGGNILWYFG